MAKSAKKTNKKQLNLKDTEKVSNFLSFISGSFYTKESFIEEAAKMGISRRMPSHHLPADMISGKSRIYVATGGERKAGSEAPAADIFGWYTPSRVEFIAGKNGKKFYAEVVASLKLRPDTIVLDTVEGEPARGCGHRKDGATYLVVDKADSPLNLMSAIYEGNHFRGLMRLTGEQSAAIEAGVLSTVVDEICMDCGADMQCAPDGHKRADRERRRMEKGEDAKWLLRCSDCRQRVTQEQAEARKIEKEREAQATTQ